MDRKSWIAIILSIAGLFVWQWYITKYYPQPEPVPAGMAPTATPGPVAPPVAPIPAAPPAPPSMAPKAQSLESGDVEFVFNNDTGGIEQVVLRMHMGEDREHVALNRSRTMPVGALGFEPGEVLGGFSMNADKAAGRVLFQKRQSDGLEISKRFSLPDTADGKNQYLVDLEVVFRNTGTEALTVPDFFVGTGGAAPIHALDLPMYTRFDWGHESSMSNIDVNWFGASSIPLIGIELHGERELYLESEPDIR